MNLPHQLTPVTLLSVSKFQPKTEEQATTRDVPEMLPSNDKDSTEVPEKTQGQPVFQHAEREPSLVTSIRREVDVENNVVGTSSGVTAGDSVAANVRDNVNSDSPPSLSEDLHIEESGTTAVVFTFAALSQVSIGASVAFLPVLLLQLTRSTTTFLNTELHLIHSQIVLADCLLLAGLVIALVASGWLVSTIGRRCSMIAATLVSIASWLVHALATDVTILFLGRFLAGVSAGFLKLSVTTYIMEVIVVSNRGRVLVCLEMMKIFGSIISYGLNLLLPWYHIAFLNGTWMVVCMIAFIFLPESPAFLLIKQKEEKALKELQRIRSSDSKVDAELQIIKSLNPEERAKCTSLFGKPVISNTITILGLLLLSVFCGSPIIMIRGADMLLYTGFGWRMEAAVVLVLICLFLGCLLLFCLVDEISRRLCLMMSLAILVVVNIALGVISYITSHSITDATHDTPMVLARVCLILVAAFTVTLGSHTVPTILAAEYFHAYCRPQGLSMFFTISVLLQTLILYLQPLIEETFGLAGLHWIFAIVAFLGIFYTNYCVRDIKYRTHKLSNICHWLYKENFYEPRPLI
ncbi:facilitated trehalose transporter Tret1-like [Portunus trituberculatus]|uniref:facilitated trehalose transporter Tret1-like n=1 Tax=Portunus trituberculatus TaxID=210409 RepID=UPI001E1CBD2B|nr:facilitated trehalose transporter Tret1-like [Portunus trituberculatus]